MRGERRALIVGSALVLAFFAVMLWLVGREPSDPSISAPATQLAAATPTTSAAPALPVAHDFAPAEQTAPLVPPTPPPITLPPDTQRLAEEFVPGTTEWEEVPVLEDGAQILRFLPAHYNVIAPAPIVLYLEVIDTQTKQRVALRSPHARVRPFDKPDDWIDIPMVDNGSHRYVATLTPTRAQQDKLLGRVVAEGVVELPDAGTRRIPQALIYTKGPRAHLTGRWRDELKDGHLVLSAEISVDEEGLFTLMAQLVGPAREPIALAKTMTRLPRGTQWMTMRVWGKAIRDVNVDGPYEVRNVLLTRDMNERGDYDPGPTVASAHKTRAYHAKDFTDEAYVEPPRNEPVIYDNAPALSVDRPSQRN